MGICFDETVWFSVIMPVYNAEKYLKKSIDSVLSQTFNNFELLLIDDGSTDHSYELCKRYALLDERIRVYTKENGGAFQTRLFATQYAKGKYIIFCDADDQYLNSICFEKMFKLTKEEKYDLIQFNYIKKYNHMKRSIKSVDTEIEVDNQEFYINDYPILLCNNYSGSRLTNSVWNKIYRKELFDRRFDFEMSLRLFMGDDLVINLSVVQKCKNILFTPQILYVYNDLTGGTTKFRVNEMEDLNIVKEYQIKYLKKWKAENQSTNYDKVEQALYGEIAAWFFLFIQHAMNYMKIEDIKKLIKEALGYSTFKKAVKYYKNHPTENWMAVNLLKEGNIERYIEEAKKQKMKKLNFISSMKNILTTMYKRI